MRIMVFFDLPTVTPEDRKHYRKFRKHLIKNGFIMMQESVYCRLVLNQSVQDNVIKTVEKEKPPDGIVQILSITEKQFSKIEYLVGEQKSEVINSDERIIII